MALNFEKNPNWRTTLTGIGALLTAVAALMIAIGSALVAVFDGDPETALDVQAFLDQIPTIFVAIVSALSGIGFLRSRDDVVTDSEVKTYEAMKARR